MRTSEMLSFDNHSISHSIPKSMIEHKMICFFNIVYNHAYKRFVLRETLCGSDIESKIRIFHSRAALDDPFFSMIAVAFLKTKVFKKMYQIIRF